MEDSTTTRARNTPIAIFNSSSLNKIILDSYEESEEVYVMESDKICRIGKDSYVTCPEYCCGEIWESSWSYCCTNNFKAIRNLFLFLLVTLVIQFGTIIIYLIIELYVKSYIKDKFDILSDTLMAGPSSEFLSINKDLISSDDTTLDDDSSMDERTTPSLIMKNHKRFLNKHSQSFKDMSKVNSFRRNLAKNLKSRRLKS